MNLFFETSRQAWCFLCMAPLGIAVSFLADADVIAGRLRAVADTLLLLLAGMAALVMIVLCRETGLRLYHLLGLLTGTVLYFEGIGKIIRFIGRRQDLKRRAEK